MSIDSRLNTAIKTVVTNVAPNVYTGTSTEYVVYTYDEIPDLFADGKPDAKVYSIFVDYFLPNGINPRANKKAIANALKNAGFTYPDITNVGDSDGQRYTFECEGTDGDV